MFDGNELAAHRRDLSLPPSEGNYEIKSNRESGLGRFDIMLIPKDINELGIILELKAAKDNGSLKKQLKKH